MANGWGRVDRITLRLKDTIASRDGGFTLVEMVVIIVIIGIILSISVISYANISRDLKLGAARKQVGDAIGRAKLSARQENVDYQITFYPGDGSTHPNTYEVQRAVYDQGAGMWSTEPVDKSVSGEKVIEDGGHYYVEVTSPVTITNGDTIQFHPSGTLLLVTTVPGGEGRQAIGLSFRGKTGSVSIDAQGKITLE